MQWISDEWELRTWTCGGTDRRGYGTGMSVMRNRRTNTWRWWAGVYGVGPKREGVAPTEDAAKLLAESAYTELCGG